MNKIYNTLRILSENGWEWDSDDEREDCFVYKAKFLGMYTTTISAFISSNSNHLHHFGNYGVLWLAGEYESDLPYGASDMEDMIHAIDLAEKNLLLIGMPFTPDYKFQSNNGNRRRRNDKLRKMYGLEEKENEDSQKNRERRYENIGSIN